MADEHSFTPYTETEGHDSRIQTARQLLRGDSYEDRRSGVELADRIARRAPERGAELVPELLSCFSWNPARPDTLTRAEQGAEIAFRPRELTGDVVDVLLQITREAPEAVDPETVVERVARDVLPEYPEFRTDAIQLLHQLSMNGLPDTPVYTSVVPTLLDVVSDHEDGGASSPDVQQSLALLSLIADVRPQAVVRSLDRVGSFTHIDDSYVQTPLLRTLRAVAEFDAERVTHVVSQAYLDRCLSATYDPVRYEALGLIAAIGDTDPDYATRFVPGVRRLLVDADPEVREAAVNALGAVLVGTPTLAERSLPRLETFASDVREETNVVAAVAEVFDSLAAAQPAVAVEHLETIEQLLERDHAETRVYAIQAVHHLLDEEPAAVLTPTVVEASASVVEDEVINGSISAGKVVASHASVDETSLESVFTTACRSLHGDFEARLTGTAAIAGIASIEPGRAAAAVPRVSALLAADDPVVATAAFNALATLTLEVDGDPSRADLDLSRDQLLSYFDSNYDQFTTIADEQPGLARSVTPQLLELVVDGGADQVERALDILLQTGPLSYLADDGLVEQIVALAESRDASELPVNATVLLPPVAEQSPELVEPLLSLYLDEMDAIEPEARFNVLNATQFAARSNPEVLVGHLGIITEHLQPPFRERVLRTFLEVSKTQPTALYPYLEEIGRQVADLSERRAQIAVEIMLNVIGSETSETMPAVETLARVLVTEPEQFSVDTVSAAEAFEDGNPIGISRLFYLISGGMAVGYDDSAVDEWYQTFVTTIQEEAGEQSPSIEPVLGLWATLMELAPSGPPVEKADR